jgi:hypothetical protein
MKMRSLSVAVPWILGILYLVATPLGVGAQVIPNEVAVKPCESPRLLFPDDDYCIQLEFNRAPEGYDGGTIYATFKQTSGPPPTNRFADVDVYATDNALSKIDLINHRAIYKLTMHINEPMAPGTWELKEITLGHIVQKQIPISGTASFEIGEPSPIIFHVHAPSSVKAGETYNVTVILDKYPAHLYRGCELELEIALKPASPGSYSFEFDPQEITPDEHSYTFSHRIASDFPKSSLQGEVGTQASRGCRFPEVQGDLHFKFEVEPNTGVVTPTSVKVIVNPSQVQLLRGEIDRLNAERLNLKDQLKTKDAAGRQAVLRNSLEKATTELANTEAQYKKQETNPANLPVANIFFNDLKLTYDDAAKALTGMSARITESEPRLTYASAIEDDPPRINASEVVLKSIDRNISAYQFAVSNLSLYFNLEVRSEPEQDAAISYIQGRGKPFVSWPERTNSTLQNRERSFYTIRIQKSGYGDQCVDFDAMTDPSTSITITLKHEDGCKQ